MTEINCEGPTPDTDPINVKDGQLSWQGEYQRFGIVSSQRLDFPVFVWYLNAVWSGLVSVADPKKSICSRLRE